MNQKVLLLLGMVFAIFVGFWVYKEVNKPLPGEKLEDLGAEHVVDIYGKTYNSNPPTSGPHFPVWAKPGFYDRVISDGHLIHSLEHGYIVISYDCTKPLLSGDWLVRTANAHEGVDDPTVATDSATPLMHMNVPASSGMSAFTPENAPAKEVELPSEFSSQQCKDLENQLKEFLKVEDRVIVVPRIGMDVPIAMTAWTRILKLNKVEKSKMNEFIEAYHNKGPEKTVE